MSNILGGGGGAKNFARASCAEKKFTLQAKFLFLFPFFVSKISCPLTEILHSPLAHFILS